MHRIVLEGVKMDTSDIVNQHDYGIINIYDPDSEGFYLVQFISISFTL